LLANSLSEASGGDDLQDMGTRMAEWFDPETLDAAQSEVHKTAIGDMNTAGGFGSYAVANRGAGLAGSAAGSHNLLFASQRVSQYAAVLGGRSFERRHYITSVSQKKFEPFNQFIGNRSP